MFKFISKHSKKALLAVELCAVNALLAKNAIAQETTITGVASRAESMMGSVTIVATALCTLVGLIMIGNSLNNLYKASKDPSHQVKPMAGIIGLIIGGFLAAIGAVLTIMSNSVGTTA
jgi:sulfite exporter TauE/SafE